MASVIFSFSFIMNIKYKKGLPCSGESLFVWLKYYFVKPYPEQSARFPADDDVRGGYG
jgi:hypothetical protein